MAPVPSIRERSLTRAGRAARATPVAVLLLAAAACDPYVQGNGVFREEPRGVPAFHGLSVADGIEGTVLAGATSQSLVVSGDENVIQYVETTVDEDGVLVARMSGHVPYDSIHPIRVVAHVPAMDVFRAHEATRITATGVAAGSVVVDASDGSTVTLSGPGGASLEATLGGGDRGGAHLAAGSYPVARAVVQLSGGAHAELLAAEEISGTARGGSAIENLGAGTCAVVLVDGSTCGP